MGALNLLLSNHAGVEVDVAEARLGPVAGHKDRGGAAFLDALLVSVWERVHFCAHADFAGVVGSRVVVDVAKLVKVVCVLLGFFGELFGVLPNRAVVLALSLLFLRQRLLAVVVLFAAEAPQLDAVDAPQDFATVPSSQNVDIRIEFDTNECGPGGGGRFS